jgi:ABC-type glycerol-3-phosphate transport system substrate-binding protein
METEHQQFRTLRTFCYSRCGGFCQHGSHGGACPVTALAGGGGGYDLFFVPSADAVNLMAGGYFESLNDMMSESDKKNWLPSVTNLYTVNGQLLAMPWYAGGAHMAYNKKILQAAGVDPDSIKTWDGFMAACAKIKETNAARFCFAPSAKYRGEFDYFWGSMHASRGGKLFDASGSPIFQNDGQALAVNKMVQEGISKGYFDPAGQWQ